MDHVGPITHGNIRAFRETAPTMNPQVWLDRRRLPISLVRKEDGEGVHLRPSAGTRLHCLLLSRCLLVHVLL
jgi:hypothetical protein